MRLSERVSLGLGILGFVAWLLTWRRLARDTVEGYFRAVARDAEKASSLGREGP